MKNVWAVLKKYEQRIMEISDLLETEDDDTARSNLMTEQAILEEMRADVATAALKDEEDTTIYAVAIGVKNYPIINYVGNDYQKSKEAYFEFGNPTFEQWNNGVFVKNMEEETKSNKE